jgi:hypothetical protein
MPGGQSRIICVGMLASVMLLGTGCRATAPESGGPLREYVPAEIQPGLGESIVSESSVDTKNRYLATVSVDGGRGACSGVLVAPRVVLTAGHCVCSPHALRQGDDEGRMLLDATECARTATIKSVAYKADGAPLFGEYIGTVRSHEQLEVLYDGRNRELSSRADVAVLVLDRTPAGVKPVSLTTRQVQYSQPVVLVGYGDDGGGEQGQRRFGFNEVATIEESGATFLVGKPILFRQPYKAKQLVLMREKASYSRKGDSGGPCLREKGGRVELLGIAKTYYGDLVEFSECTSVFFYQGWIRAEIDRAAQVDTD